MPKVFVLLMFACLAFAASSCTWVKPTAAGESVRVADAVTTSACDRKGKVTVSLKDRIAGMDRKASKVAAELETLARNEGALLGGNTVVAESEIEDGRQVFGVFDCRRPAH